MPLVGPKGGYIIEEEDRPKFMGIIQVNDQAVALQGSIVDLQAKIESLRQRMKTLQELKTDLEQQKLALEFETFPKYGLKPGQPFTAESWELKGVGPQIQLPK